MLEVEDMHLLGTEHRIWLIVEAYAEFIDWISKYPISWWTDKSWRLEFFSCTADIADDSLVMNELNLPIPWHRA